MRKARAACLAVLLSLAAPAAPAQEHTLALSLHEAAPLVAHNVSVAAVRYGGSDALAVRLTGPYRGPDRDTFAFVPDLDFHDGTIEVDVAGSLLPTALTGARGFVGIAFRIDERGGSFACEGLYIRPTNGHAEDPARREHATQYFSFPGYDFDRLRREAPGRYESAADVAPDRWIHLRIEVAGSSARLYVGDAAEPVLTVTDLKRGADAHGTVGLFVDNGTDGHFRNLTVRSRG
ncbi:MAG TPA: hypothetical protein VMU85_13800 [Stellaceae bacterium]|nr:hypothetical protein [Stellaceae bacterium]